MLQTITRKRNDNNNGFDSIPLIEDDNDVNDSVNDPDLDEYQPSSNKNKLQRRRSHDRPMSKLVKFSLTFVWYRQHPRSKDARKIKSVSRSFHP